MTTCAKETDPAAVPTVPAMWPMAWKVPIGINARYVAAERRGRRRRPVNQSRLTKSEPTTTVAVATDHGQGSALVTRLFVME